MNNEPSKWAVEAARLLTLLRAADNFTVAQREQICGEHIQSAIDAALAEKDKENEKLRYYLERAGWGPCSIPACNCNGWHKLRESRDEKELNERLASLQALMERVLASTFRKEMPDLLCREYKKWKEEGK